MSTDRIIEKVQKLLRLANNAGATDGEIDNAMRMAHGLLAKHNLSMSDVEEKTEGMEEHIFIFRNRPWVRRTIKMIAKLYFCEYVVYMHDKRTKTRHLFIGKESNVITAKSIAEFVVTTIKKRAGQERRLLNENSAFESSFCEGASYQIIKRIGEMLKDANEEPVVSGTGKEIALKTIYEQEAIEIEEYMQEKFKKSLTTVKGSSRTIKNQQAFGSGSKYAEKIHLGQQLENSKTEKLS